MRHTLHYNLPRMLQFYFADVWAICIEMNSVSSNTTVIMVRNTGASAVGIASVQPIQKAHSFAPVQLQVHCHWLLSLQSMVQCSSSAGMRTVEERPSSAVGSPRELSSAVRPCPHATGVLQHFKKK